MKNNQFTTEKKHKISLEAVMAAKVKAIANIIDKVRRYQNINIIFKSAT